jgi:hypothetical protein
MLNWKGSECGVVVCFKQFIDIRLYGLEKKIKNVRIVGVKVGVQPGLFQNTNQRRNLLRVISLLMPNSSFFE